MLEAMNTALSALGAYLRKQDVTANNIANANTHDFKKSRADFQETSPDRKSVV
jgi:flagellar basal-body rod protein FlgB